MMLPVPRAQTSVRALEGDSTAWTPYGFVEQGNAIGVIERNLARASRSHPGRYLASILAGQRVAAE